MLSPYAWAYKMGNVSLSRNDITTRKTGVLSKDKPSVHVGGKLISSLTWKPVSFAVLIQITPQHGYVYVDLVLLHNGDDNVSFLLSPTTCSSKRGWLVYSSALLQGRKKGGECLSSCLYLCCRDTPIKCRAFKSGISVKSDIISLLLLNCVATHRPNDSKFAAM